MRNADMMVEMIRLCDQYGEVLESHLYDNDYLTVKGKTKDGKEFSLSLIVNKEEKKDA